MSFRRCTLRLLLKLFSNRFPWQRHREAIIVTEDLSARFQTEPLGSHLASLTSPCLAAFIFDPPVTNRTLPRVPWTCLGFSSWSPSSVPCIVLVGSGPHRKHNRRDWPSLPSAALTALRTAWLGWRASSPGQDSMRSSQSALNTHHGGRRCH